MNRRVETKRPARAIVADDHPLVLLAVENLLASQPHLEVVGRASDGVELFDEAEAAGCDLVVMDLHMPCGAADVGFEMVRRFRMRFPRIAIVVLTMEIDVDMLRRLIALGVGAIVSKRDRIDLIHVAIVTALAGEHYVGPTVRTLLADATLARRFAFVRDLLSPRELEVLTHYAAGRRVSEIAARLGRSVKTVSAQKCTAMRKLSLQCDADLFRFVVDHGVFPGATRQPGC
jgi:two-component system capsular synthesis response regulator RcsB